jgi:hypothetical protein
MAELATGSRKPLRTAIHSEIHHAKAQPLRLPKSESCSQYTRPYGGSRAFGHGRCEPIGQRDLAQAGKDATPRFKIEDAWSGNFGIGVTPETGLRLTNL